MNVIYATPITYHGYPVHHPPPHEPPHPGPQPQTQSQSYPASTKRAPSNSGDEAPPKQKQKRSKSTGRGKAKDPVDTTQDDPNAAAVSIPDPTGIFYHHYPVWNPG